MKLKETELQNRKITKWLAKGDPSIRFQVMKNFCVNLKIYFEMEEIGIPSRWNTLGH